PVGWKADAAAGDDLLQLLNEGGVRLLERLELVEERIDDDRGDEDSEEDRRHGRNPEPEPPARRRSADSPEEQQDQHGADDPDEEKALGLVPEPARPALNGEPVAEAEVVPIDRKRRVE